METWFDRRDAGIPEAEFMPFAEGVDDPVPETIPALLAALFDQLPHGVMVMTLDGYVLHANRSGIAAINGTDIWIDADMRLIVQRPADATVLRRAIAATAGLRRSLVVLGSGQCSLAVAVHPLSPSPGGRTPRRALLLFGRAALCDALAMSAFARTHRLTPAEITVLDALCEGLRAKEVALRLESSIATVRSHLRSIYHKTSSRDLRDVLAHLAMLPPVSAAPE